MIRRPGPRSSDALGAPSGHRRRHAHKSDFTAAEHDRRKSQGGGI